MSWRCIAVAGCGLAFAVGVSMRTSVAASPQTALGTSSHSVGNGFFENNGVNFGFNLPAGLPTNGQSAVVGLTPQGAFNSAGIGFQQGGAAAAQNPVGGFVPNQANTFGFTINSSLGSF